MAVDTKLPYDEQYITEYSQKRNEPEWFRDIRLEALRQSEDLPMAKANKTRIIDWNFTNFKHDVAGEPIQDFDTLPEQVRVLLGEEGSAQNLIIVRNNDVAYANLSQELKDKGVIFEDIFTAMNEHSDLVQKYFMKDGVAIDENKMTARHAALMNSGIFVYVPKNVVVDEPIQVVFWQEDDEAGMINHVLLVAEENSEVTYLENYYSAMRIKNLLQTWSVKYSLTKTQKFLMVLSITWQKGQRLTLTVVALQTVMRISNGHLVK